MSLIILGIILGITTVWFIFYFLAVERVMQTCYINIFDHFLIFLISPIALIFILLYLEPNYVIENAKENENPIYTFKPAYQDPDYKKPCNYPKDTRIDFYDKFSQS